MINYVINLHLLDTSDIVYYRFKENSNANQVYCFSMSLMFLHEFVVRTHELPSYDC